MKVDMKNGREGEEEQRDYSDIHGDAQEFNNSDNEFIEGTKQQGEGEEGQRQQGQQRQKEQNLQQQQQQYPLEDFNSRDDQSQEQLQSIQSANDKLRENLEAARKENEVLFKEVRVKTQNIIASPERIRKELAEEEDYEDYNEGQRSQLNNNNGGIIKQQSMEYSSMNVNDRNRNLEQESVILNNSKKQLNRQVSEESLKDQPLDQQRQQQQQQQSVIVSSNVNRQMNNKSPIRSIISTVEIQQKKIGEGVYGGDDDELADDYLMLDKRNQGNNEQMKKLLDSSKLSEKQQMTGKQQIIKKQQGEQFQIKQQLIAGDRLKELDKEKQEQEDNQRRDIKKNDKKEDKRELQLQQLQEKDSIDNSRQLIRLTRQPGDQIEKNNNNDRDNNNNDQGNNLSDRNNNIKESQGRNNNQQVNLLRDTAVSNQGVQEKQSENKSEINNNNKSNKQPPYNNSNNIISSPVVLSKKPNPDRVQPSNQELTNDQQIMLNDKNMKSSMKQQERQQPIISSNTDNNKTNNIPNITNPSGGLLPINTIKTDNVNINNAVDRTQRYQDMPVIIPNKINQSQKESRIPGNNSVSKEQWEQIQKQLGNDDFNSKYNIITPKNGNNNNNIVLSTEQSIVNDIEEEEEDNDEGQKALDIKQTNENSQDNNTSNFDDIFQVIQFILQTFNYTNRRATVNALIQSKTVLTFPNIQRLSNRYIDETMIPAEQLAFLSSLVRFDCQQFSGDARSLRQAKSLNIQKSLVSDVALCDSTLSNETFNFSQFLSSEDFARSCEEHYTKKSIRGMQITYSVQHEPYLTGLRLNRLLMQDLKISQFKIKDNTQTQQQQQFQLSTPQYDGILHLNGTITTTQQRVSMLRCRISEPRDILMQEQEIKIMGMCHQNIFIKAPVACVVASEGTEWYLYKIYAPFQQSLTGYLKARGNKLNFAEKLSICLQMALGLYAIQSTNHNIGGIIHPDQFVVEIPTEKAKKGLENLRIKVKWITALAGKSNINGLIVSPETRSHGNIEFRSDVFALVLMFYGIFTGIDFNSLVDKINNKQGSIQLSQVFSNEDSNSIESPSINNNTKGNQQQQPLSPLKASQRVQTLENNNNTNPNSVSFKTQLINQHSNIPMSRAASLSPQQKSILKNQSINANPIESDLSKILQSFIDDPKIPRAIQLLLQLTLTENYRDRISCAGVCMYLQHLLNRENSESLNTIIKFPIDKLGTLDYLVEHSFKLLPFEQSTIFPINKGIFYLENGCFYGSIDKSGKLTSGDQSNDKGCYIFQLETQSNSVKVFIAEFISGKAQMSFQFSSKGESMRVQQQSIDNNINNGKAWQLETVDQQEQLVESVQCCGMTVQPGELEAEFIKYAVSKHFKLLDHNNAILIGNYDVYGMHGIAASVDVINNIIQLGSISSIKELTKNTNHQDTLVYQKSRVYFFQPPQDYKSTHRLIAETPTGISIKQLCQEQPIVLRFPTAENVQFTIRKISQKDRLEYISLDELVVLCLSKKESTQQKRNSINNRIVAVMDMHMQLHSFLPASSVAHISDIKIDGIDRMFLGIALDIDKEGIYAGQFQERQGINNDKKSLKDSQKVQGIEKNKDMTMQRGFYINTKAKPTDIDNFVVNKCIKNMAVF